jgi:hypothetical protein
VRYTDPTGLEVSDPEQDQIDAMEDASVPTEGIESATEWYDSHRQNHDISWIPEDTLRAEAMAHQGEDYVFGINDCGIWAKDRVKAAEGYSLSPEIEKKGFRACRNSMSKTTVGNDWNIAHGVDNKGKDDGSNGHVVLVRQYEDGEVETFEMGGHGNTTTAHVYYDSLTEFEDSYGTWFGQGTWRYAPLTE